MLYDALSPDAYLAALEEDWRKDTLLRLRALIRNEAPDLEERMHYKMLGYGLGDRYVFHLNAQKGCVSLYARHAAKIDPQGTLLHGLSVGKGCIRFSKTKSVPGTRIDDFIARAIALWRAGGDTGC